MPMELVDLEIEEVSSVGRAANNRTFLIIKRAEEADACTDEDCDDPDCPVHGTTVDKDLSPPHGEPDMDEATPRDYATRSQQRELWGCLWEKWEQFYCTFCDIIGDGDADNIPHLPILVTSIGQFQADVEQLLADCGVLTKAAPLLTRLTRVAKAGAAMAGHRRTRLQDAIAALQALLEECTPEDLPHGINPTIDRAGVSAADVAGIPAVMKGVSMADKGTVVDGNVAQAQIDTLTARVQELDTQLAASQTALAKTQADLKVLEDSAAIAKMSPEDQRTALLASMPELVRKSYLDQETRLALVEKTNNDLRDRNERMEYIAKTADLRGMGFVPDDHWPILKAIDQMEEAPRTELLRLLKAGSEQLRASPLFQALGTEGHAAGGQNGSAEQQLMELAQSYSTEKSVPLDKAIEAVVKAHPELYQRNMLEKRQTNRVQLGSR